MFILSYPHACRSGRSLRVTWGMVTDTRTCEQCGASFAPRREHARFCSARCRVAWNRLHASGSPAEGGALDWTITAMRDTIDRLLRARSWDRPHAFAVISEAVWWVTMVDATLVRYHPDAYDGVLASHDAAGRRKIEGTFGGLRFVRNQMGYYQDHADFIQPVGPRAGAIAAWTWRSLPEPGLGLASGPWAGVGDDALPGVPGLAGGPARGRDLQPGRAFLRLASDSCLTRS